MGEETEKRGGKRQRREKKMGERVKRKWVRKRERESQEFDQLLIDDRKSDVCLFSFNE